MDNEHDDLQLSRAYEMVDTMDQQHGTVPPEVLQVLTMINTKSKADNFFHQGNGVVGFDGMNGHAEWKLENSGGTFWVFVQLAAEEPRPLCLSFLSSNGAATIVSNSIAADCVTGSWGNETLQWFHHGPYQLEGDVTLRMDTDGYWPHVKQFVLVPTTVAPVKPLSKSYTMNSIIDQAPKLLQLSHAGVAARLDSISSSSSSRQPPSQGNQNGVIAVLHKPTKMSENVDVGDTMIIVDGTTGYYELEFINEVWATEVYLDVTFSSGDSRPVLLSVNGRVVGRDCFSDISGGFDEQDFINVRCGPYQIRPEVNTIKLTTAAGYFPHVGEIRIVDARAATDNVTEPSPRGTWIVPPSRPMRPEMVSAISSICFVENTQEPYPDFKPDPDFYNGINLDGLWVLASKEVDKRILNQAAELLCRYVPIELRRLCLQWRAPLDMPRGPFRVVILDHETDQKAGDCPDFPSELEGRNGTSNPGVFTSADDFSLHPRFGPCGELTVHEVMHGLDMVIRQQLDPYFFQQVDDCFRAAVESKVYKKSYAAADRHEYLAEICTLFVGTNPENFKNGCCQCAESDSGYCGFERHADFPPGKVGVSFCRKSDLMRHDVKGYELLKTFLIEPKDPQDDSFWWE